MTNINKNNYEEFFISYMEGELSTDERLAVEAFIEQNPELKNEMVLFEMTKLSQPEIIFPNKDALLKKETKFIWFGSVARKALAIAALLCGVVLCFYLFKNKKIETTADNQLPKSDSFKTENVIPAKNDASASSATNVVNEIPKKMIQKMVIEKRIIIREENKNSFVSNKKINRTVNEMKPETIALAALDLKQNLQNGILEKQLPDSNIANSIPDDKEFMTQAIAKSATEEVLASAPIKINHQGREVIKMLGWASDKLWGDDANNQDIDVQAGFFEFKHTTKK